MTGAGWSTLMSPRIPRRNGRHSQLREAFPFDQVPRYLLRDRDKIFGDTFREHVKNMQLKEVLSAPRSPWQRAYVERAIGSIRRAPSDRWMNPPVCILYCRFAPALGPQSLIRLVREGYSAEFSCRQQFPSEEDGS
jgi:hypothetical protein